MAGGEQGTTVYLAFLLLLPVRALQAESKEPWTETARGEHWQYHRDQDRFPVNQQPCRSRFCRLVEAAPPWYLAGPAYIWKQT